MRSSQWQEYLDSYYEQKRLEEYQKTRVLAKPNTTKTTVAIYLIIWFGLVFIGAVGVFSVLHLKVWLDILILFFYVILVFETYGRLVSIKIIECYQHYASEERRRKCKCIPSCSEYAIICFKKYEMVYALVKIRRRLFVTCQGFDYIIDKP